MTHSPVQLKVNAYGAGDAQLYETLPDMVEALVAIDPWLQQRGRLILEPACGPGAITAVLQGFGHTVLSSDLNQYQLRWKGKPGPGVEAPSWGVDFFDYKPAALAQLVAASPQGRDNFAIVTNPPYGTGEPGADSLAARFALHALRLAPRVYLLLELGFCQGGERCPHRDGLIDGPHLSGVFPFRERCPMHRDGFAGRKAAQARRHAWYRWQRDHKGGVEFKRVSRRVGTALSSVHAQGEAASAEPASRPSRLGASAGAKQELSHHGESVS